MARSKILIPVKVLENLYQKRGWAPRRIGAQYGCDAVTVRTRLKEAGIPLKTKSVAQTKHKRHEFNGSDTEKAYILGFKYGDLNAYMPSGVSETVVVRCHTTRPEQAKLFIKIFKRYGTIKISKNPRSEHLTVYLNRSFVFLLGKYPDTVRRWLSSDETLLWAFTAGYIDAEGSFGLNQGKGRFKVDAYDYEILSDIHHLFLNAGIRSKFRVIAKEGENDYGWVWKRDVWRISVNEAASLEALIQRVKPFLLHTKRISDAQKVMRNILLRRTHGSIK